MTALPARALAAPRSLPQPYPITKHFAFYLALRLCESRALWARIGEYLQPEALPCPVARMVATHAAELARELGHGPASRLLTLQRIRRSVDDGARTESEVSDLIAMMADFDALCIAAEARGESPPSDDAIAAEVLPFLKARTQRQALVEGGQLLAAGNTAALAEIGQRLLDAERVGQLAVDDDDGWGEARATIESVQGLPRCSVGVEELDAILRGGPHLGSYTTWAAGTGGSKSTAVCHALATALLRRKNCLFVTLEMPKWEAWAKVIANLTGVPLDAVRENAEGGWAALAGLQSKLGDIRIGRFPDGASVADIAAWRQRKQQQHGMAYDVVAVDGVDHLSDRTHNGRDGTYELGRKVCTALDLFATGGAQGEDPIWLHVTSHLQRGKTYSEKAADGTRVPGKDDLADSKHRANKTHYLITNTVQRDESGAEAIYFNLAKSRFSRSNIVIGPLPCDMATARLVMPYLPPPVVDQSEFAA